MGAGCKSCDWFSRVMGDGTFCHLHELLVVLAHNLAIGAALCRAFRLGHDPKHGGCWLDFCDGWQPGCGSPAPHVEGGR